MNCVETWCKRKPLSTVCRGIMLLLAFTFITNWQIIFADPIIKTITLLTKRNHLYIEHSHCLLFAYTYKLWCFLFIYIMHHVNTLPSAYSRQVILAEDEMEKFGMFYIFGWLLGQWEIYLNIIIWLSRGVQMFHSFFTKNVLYFLHDCCLEYTYIQ